MPDCEAPRDVVDVSRQLAAALEARQQDYALGGAIALGFWAKTGIQTVYVPRLDFRAIVGGWSELHSSNEGRLGISGATEQP